MASDNQKEKLCRPRSGPSIAQTRFMCMLCDERRFSRKSNFDRHCKTVHKVIIKYAENRENLHKSFRCDRCCFVGFTLGVLRNHHISAHGFISSSQRITFATRKEFLDWKETEEKNSTSLFVAQNGPKKLQSGTKRYLICNRSGFYKTKGKGKKQLKSQGSNKIDKYCLASMEVLETENKIQVTYHREHYGHSPDIAHLPLEANDKVAIAGKLAEGVPLQCVLDDIRNSTAEKVSRLHLLTRQDLYNIRRNFSLAAAMPKLRCKKADVLKKMEIITGYLQSGTNYNDEVLSRLSSALDDFLVVAKNAQKNVGEPVLSREPPNKKLRQQVGFFSTKKYRKILSKPAFTQKANIIETPTNPDAEVPNNNANTDFDHTY